MLLGQSIFQSVLTRLTHEGEDETGDPQGATAGEPAGESFRVRGLGAGFVANTAREDAHDDVATDRAAGAQAYFAFMDEEPEPAGAPEQAAKEEAATEEPTPEASHATEEPKRAAAGSDPGTDKRPPLRPGADTPRASPQHAEPPGPAPARLLRLSQEEIAQELSISPQDTEASLAEKRRRFAKANHPDRVAPRFRDNANRRMQIANLLIDQAIKRLAWR